MKKIMLAALSCVLIASLIGCGEKKNDKSGLNNDVEANYTVIALDNSPANGLDTVSYWDEQRTVDENKINEKISSDVFGEKIDFTYKNSFIPVYDWEYVDVYENENKQSVFAKNGKVVGFEDNSREFADRQLMLDIPEKLKFSDDTDPLYVYTENVSYFEENAQNAIKRLGIEDIIGYTGSYLDCFNVSDFYNDGETIIKEYKLSFVRPLYDGVTNGWYDSNDRYVVTFTEKGEIYSVYAANIGAFDGYEIDGLTAVPLFNGNIADFKKKVYGNEYKESNKIVTKTPDGKTVLCETVDVYKGLHIGKYMLITPLE